MISLTLVTDSKSGVSWDFLVVSGPVLLATGLAYGVFRLVAEGEWGRIEFGGVPGAVVVDAKVVIELRVVGADVLGSLVSMSTSCAWQFFQSKQSGDLSC